MTQAGPLRWQTGTGWLVLTGGEPQELAESDLVDTVVLRWAYPSRPITVLPTAGGALSKLEELAVACADLGATGGYVVPIFEPADAHRDENYQLLADSGLTIIADGPDVVRLVRALRGSPALEALELAFLEGGSVLALGAAAMALGAWVSESQAQEPAEPGLCWIPDVIIEPRFVGAESAKRLRVLLAAHSECLGLGIPEETALALGPDGQVEPIGASQVTVVVGQPQGEARQR